MHTNDECHHPIDFPERESERGEEIQILNTEYITYKHNKREPCKKILNKNYNSRYIWQTVCKLLWREENMVTEM